MKKILFLLFIVIIGSQTFAIAQDLNKMMKDAQKLSYEGQIKHAEELMGSKTKKGSKGNTASDGWDTNALVLGMIWGAIGTGYFIYGKKQSRFIFLICGIVLCVFPMLVTNNTASLIIGLLMCILPFKING